MAFGFHPSLSTYPGAPYHPSFNSPHLLTQGGMSQGYWGAAPLDFPMELPIFEPPPAIVAMMEGRGTGFYGGTGGPPYNYGWPKWGPMPLKPELGGFIGKLNPYGRAFPHGFYKTLQ